MEKSPKKSSNQVKKAEFQQQPGSGIHEFSESLTTIRGMSSKVSCNSKSLEENLR